ncbi:MAG: STAS domain-containing protein [Phycisphaeraceae bacterium]
MAVQQWSDRIWVARLVGGAAFADDLAYLHAHLPRQAVTPDVVLDLAGVDAITSANLAQLLGVRRLLLQHDARLRLTAPNDAVWTLILTTGLDKVFTFAPDAATALAELQLN